MLWFSKATVKVWITSCLAQLQRFTDFLTGEQDRVVYDMENQLTLPIRSIV